jgi:hypothetical protein
MKKRTKRDIQRKRNMRKNDVQRENERIYRDHLQQEAEQASQSK